MIFTLREPVSRKLNEILNIFVTKHEHGCVAKQCLNYIKKQTKPKN